MRSNYLLWIACCSLLSSACSSEQPATSDSPSASSVKVFPHRLPAEKPDIPLSIAMERMYEYSTPRAQDNELYTTFKYTKLEGFDYHNGDGTVTRRDPSRPIFVNGKYYMWYTKRDTKVPPVGVQRVAEATDEIPSTDWDLCDIWYATSEDGFTWEEQAIAVARPEKPKHGWRSVATPDILVWKGRYYLYFQAFNEPSGLNGDWCEVSVAHADSPDGPWINTAQVAVPRGAKGDWDQDQVQDPHPIVMNDQIYLYYKAAYNKWPDVRDKYAVAHGLAISDDPLKPFKKSKLNPVLNTGHETCYFRFKKGIAALAIRDGNERETMQYAEDGVNFKVESIVSLAPTAAGAFSPDAFTGTDYGRGVTWGVAHFINAMGEGKNGRRHSILTRFDCDLSLDNHDPVFKQTTIYHTPDVYFRQGLGGLKKQRQQASKEFSL